MGKNKQLYLFDGYNVINKIPELKRFFPKELQRAREALVEYLASRRSCLGQDCEIKIIFDARKGNQALARQQIVKGICLLFADSGQEADDLIIDEVRRQYQHQQIKVVTNDNKIGNNVRAYKAKLLQVEELVRLLNPVKFSRQTAKGNVEHKINSIDGDDITTELEKLWK
ncbi:MAG: NYN domain-containing protein [bacterium]|nr:NYN domain-containing protein [bacterium]MDD5354778.1 NYN domain-containing protein [bacterium]MDD5756909.1 NYN domain-containing protein [bacterium]